LGSTFLQGIYITVVGMGLVFLSLALLLLAMIALERFFRPGETRAVAPAEETLSAERRRVAAIAAAIAAAMAEEEGVQVEEEGLGAGLREKASPWALLGRTGWVR